MLGDFTPTQPNPTLHYHSYTHTHFQIHENFEKIYYQYIALCSFVYLKLSFKASKSFEFLILSCEALVLVKML